MFLTCYLFDSRSENCYDEYELPQCVIVNEEYEGEDLDETATVKFIARLVHKDTREKSAFMEISKFKRAVGDNNKTTGGWLYLSGEVEQIDVVEVDSSEIEALEDGQIVAEESE
jgi:uncharacterized protein YchJ